MHKDTPILSIVICTYNTKELTLKCLKSLKNSINYLNQNVEVTVVENGTDGTGKYIEKNIPWVKVITPETNTGFAKGNNIGIKATDVSSKYILLLNSDVLVEENTLKKSVEFMELNPGADVLGCKIKFPDGRMQPSAGFVPTPFNITTWISGIDLIPGIQRLIPQYHPKYKSFFAKTKKVGWVMGAYFFAKRKVLIKQNGFDENLFMYLEEVDLCKRINEAGGEIWYTSDFWVTHFDKGSQMGDASDSIKREIQGMVYFIKKYFLKNSIWLLLIFKLALFFRILIFTLLGKNKRSSIYKEALSFF